VSGAPAGSAEEAAEAWSRPVTGGYGVDGHRFRWVLKDLGKGLVHKIEEAFDNAREAIEAMRRTNG
jgi:hypothetical protein